MDTKYFTSPQLYYGQYLFVSDLHGSFDQLAILSDIAHNRTPKIVFFLGDIIGTKSLRKLQELFYDYVTTPAKECLKNNPNVSDQELLDFIYDPKIGRTVLMGYQELCNYLGKLDGQNHSRTHPVDHIYRLLEYTHYGHWIGNLPESVRNVLRADLHRNAIEVIELMNEFAKNRCMVVVIEGNWEARTPLDFMPGKKCVPIPIDQRKFYFKDLIDQHGNHIEYYDKPGIILDVTCSFVTWPFDAAVTPTRVPEIESNGEKIILISHAQVSWKPIKGDKKMNPENQKIEENMPMTVSDLNPDAVVHGHLHDLLPNNASGYIFNDHTYVHYLSEDTFRFIDF